MYAKGIYFNKPHERAPKFVLGNISIKKEVLVDWLNEQTPTEKGYIKLQVLEGREKPEVKLDEWAHNQDKKPKDDISPENIPF